MKDGFYGSLSIGIIVLAGLMFLAGYKNGVKDTRCDHKRNVVIPTYTGCIGCEPIKKDCE